MPVVWLKEATKTYGNLKLRIVPIAASRSAYRSKSGRGLIEVIVKYVKSCAPEAVLVVSYKSNLNIPGVKERTIRDAVNARLSPTEMGRTAHLTWGSHTATNAHKAIRHLVFAGLNFLPPSAAYAASGAALGKQMRSNDANDHPSRDQVYDMERGMLRDSTLQAVLRGAARMGVNGDCGVMEAVVLQASQTGLTGNDFRGMFPGCTIVHDHSLLGSKPLRGNLKRLGAIVLHRQEGGETCLTDLSLYGELAVTQNNYAKLKAKPAWGAWLMANGWWKVRLAGGVTGLQR